MLPVLLMIALAAAPPETETRVDPLVQLPQLSLRLGAPTPRWGVSLPWAWHIDGWSVLLEPSVILSAERGALFTVRAGLRRVWDRGTFQEGIGAGLNAGRGYVAASPEAFIRFGTTPGKWVIAVRYEYAVDAPPEWVFCVQLTYW